MNSYTFTNIIKLLKSIVTDVRYNDIIIDDFEQLYEISKKHNIICSIFEGLYINNIEIPEDVKNKFLWTALSEIKYSEDQMLFAYKLHQKFDEVGIKHMLMKGLVIKPLYPKPEFRKMSDLDILIDYNQHDDIKRAMQTLGCNEKIQTDHEWIWDSPNNVHIELHKRMVPSYDEDLYKYYKNEWNFCKIKNNYEYAMSEEDFYIFMFTHYAKHYRYGGIGILHVLDIWILKSYWNNMDFSYINNQLKKLGLEKFYCNTMKLISAWFEDGDSTEITDVMTEFILTSGAYGTFLNTQLSQAAKQTDNTGDIKKARRSLYFQRIFLSYDRMCRLYPFLKKYMFLLPLCQIHRLIKAILFRKKELIDIKKVLDSTDDEQIIRYKTNIEKVGLKYPSKK